MTLQEAHKLLAKWAHEVATLANAFGVKFPNQTTFEIENSKQAGDVWFDPIAIRMAFQLLLMHKCYGFIFGYISENELNNYTHWFIRFSHKFGCGGEYEPRPSDSKWTHPSLRPSRLFPR